MSDATQQTTMSSDDETIPLDEVGETRLPIVELLTGRGFITGKSGSGKSNSASVIVEELLDRGFPVLIVDTDGEYWGLKEEYEVLHVGADEDCDLQVGAEHAGKFAELALDQHVPIILDVSGYLDSDEADAVVRETARELFNAEKKRKQPFLMLVEEIHEYLPQSGGTDETGEMLTRVAKRGRKRGLGICGMSQRPADVKKDYITQCDWLLWHRLTWDNDTTVVRRVVGSDAADAVGDLADGEAFLMADFMDADLQRVQLRRKRTFDAGATPDLDDYERPELKSVSGDLVDELEEISQREERRQDRIAQLETRLEEKDERIAELEEELTNARDMTDMAEQFTQAMLQSGGNGDAASEKMEDLIAERNRLQSAVDDLEAERNELRERVADLERELDERPDIGERTVEAVQVLADEFGVADGDNETLRRKLESARERINELESEVEEARSESGLPAEFEDALSFLKHEAVQDAVDRANSKVTTSEDHTWDLLFHLADDAVGSVHPDDATAVVDIHESNIRKVLNALEEKEVVEKVSDGRRKEYRLNVEGLERIVENHRKRQRAAEFRQEL